jgi:RNase P/RNase MRP subunit p30
LSYFESRLPADFRDFEEIKTKIKIYKELGLQNIILEPIDCIEKIPVDFKQKIQNESSIKIYFRINLKIETIEEFRKLIRRFNYFKDILSVESSNKEVQLHSAKDSRVDLVSFSDPTILKTLTPGVISLTKQNNSFIEFSLAPLMVSNKTIQSKNFRKLYKNIQLAQKLKANYIISGNFTNIYDFRHPRALISVCHSLLNIPMSVTKALFIKNPKKLVEKSFKTNSRGDLAS